jgi:hypothetical protein
MDEQSSANPFSRLSTELIQKIWLHRDIPGQLNFRLVNRFTEDNVRQVYAKKWFRCRVHLFTERSLRALLDIANTKRLASYVQRIELVLFDFIFAKSSWSESPRTLVVKCRVGRNRLVNPCYSSLFSCAALLQIRGSALSLATAIDQTPKCFSSVRSALWRYDMMPAATINNTLLYNFAQWWRFNLLFVQRAELFRSSTDLWEGAGVYGVDAVLIRPE